MRYLTIILCAVLVLLSFHQAQAKIIHVPADSSTIQGGIDGAVNGDTVLVAPGTYYETTVINGKAIVLASKFILTGDTNTIHLTVIDAGDAGDVIQIKHVQDINCVVSGFTVTNGNVGILCYESSPIVSHNYIVGNGGWLEAHGGIYILMASPRILCNTISGNWGAGGISGFECYDSPFPLIRENVISDNQGEQGGGIFFRDAYGFSIEENLVIGNVGVNGAAIYCSSSTGGSVVNNTISNNTGVYAGGIYCVSTDLMIRNNIISHSPDGFGVYDRISPKGTNLLLVISYNDVWGNADGNYGGDCPNQTGFNGNISEDPLFCDPQSDNFHLFNISPCVGAGANGEDIGSLGVGCLLGDANGDSVIDIADVVYLINYLFVPGSPAPNPLEAGDANCDGKVDVTDVVYLINYLFAGGPPPCEP